MNMFKRNIDYDYVWRRKEENGFVWQYYEKGLYYDPDNENYVIPTIILCIIALFTDGIPMCILVVLGAKFLTHCNNLKLDHNPRIIAEREKRRRADEKARKNN